MSALKKRRKKEKKKKRKEYEEIKRGKCPEPRKKKKSETRRKNGQVSDSRIRGTRYSPERKKRRKENIEHLILLKKKVSKEQGRYVSPQKSKSRIRLSPLLSPSLPCTIHSPHMHILI